MGGLTNSLGCRTVALIGTLIAFSGFLLSVFVHDLQILYVTFGLLGGTNFLTLSAGKLEKPSWEILNLGSGLGILFLPTSIIISFYFEKRRALATGLAVTGSGIGTFLFPVLNQALLSHFSSWRMTLVVLSAIVLNCLPCAMLFRPLRPSRDQIETVFHFVLF